MSDQHALSLDEGDRVATTSSSSSSSSAMPASPMIEDGGEEDEQREESMNDSPSRPRTSTASAASGGENIQVMCRFRPDSKDELSEGPSRPVIGYDDSDSSRVHLHLDGRDYAYTFDRVFQPTANQEDVFEEIGKPTVQSVLDGYNTAIISYGQTGSGKTYSMLGRGFDGRALGSTDADGSTVTGDPGLIPRVMQSLFNQLAALESDTVEYQVRACYIEIYLENIRDLLNPLQHEGRNATKEKKSLDVHHDAQRGMHLPKATSVPLHSLQDVFSVLRLGAKHRIVASTKANAESSRSHAILVVTVQRVHLISGAVKVAQLFMVDLAGSEKVSKTEVSGVNLTEANLINRGLLSLGQVIQALVQQGSSGKRVYIPYRNSRLTRLLSNCIGGNSRTTLLINCSGHQYNLQETFSTLRFGDNMKQIKNKAVMNVEISMAELKALYRESQAENERLKQVIKQMKNEMEIWKEMQKFEEFRIGQQRQQESATARTVSEWEEKESRSSRPPARPATSSIESTPSSRKPQSRLFLTPHHPQASPVSSTDDPASSISSAASRASASSSSSSTNSDSPEPHSAPMSSGSGSGNSGSAAKGGRSKRISSSSSSSGDERDSAADDDDDDAAADEDGEDFDIRAELHAEVTSSRNDSILRSLSRPPPSSTGGATDLRQLILHFICPLTKKIMLDPVTCFDGFTYERRAITTWFLNHGESPVTGQKLSTKMLVPNGAVKQMIRKFYPAALVRRDGRPAGMKGMLSISSSSSDQHFLSTGMSVDYFSCLPLAVLSYLFELFDHRALCRVSQLNKECYSLSKENRLWKLLSLRRGFDVHAEDASMVRELGNDVKAYFKVKWKQAQPVSAKEKARRQRKEQEFKGVYLIPAGPAGTAVHIAF